MEQAAAHVVAKQIESGVDIVNDGEVGRESFFTYVRHRMTGFGGMGARKPMRDIVMYPSYLEYALRVRAANESVSLLAPPQAVGEVTYKDARAIKHECARLRANLDALKQKPEGAFMTAPSPGIIAAAMENKHYDGLGSYIEAVGRALAVEYRAVVDAGFTLQIDAPDLAMERHTLFADKPLGEFLTFARTVVGEADRHALEPSLVLAVMHVESRYYNFAVSPVGAMGLMQVMPETGEELAARLGIRWRGPQTLFEPTVNIRLGVAYLRELSDRYYGNLPMALAAYNWGPGRIDRRLRLGTALPEEYPSLVLEALAAGRGRS